MQAPLFELGIISDSASLLAALLIGFAFGWFLERAGLGNARKLAGLFYLTDFTVLKVMFSAIVTAALGAFWLSRIGVLDLGRVAVPETWFAPQALGGLIFGAGFVIGGLCPGTSCVAAMTGRTDGLALLLGLLIGVFAFGELLPWFSGFYESGARGPITLDQVFQLSRAATTFLVVVLAFACFAAAEAWEKRAA